MVALERDRALPIIYLLGPTAAGKTQLACEIASHFDCEIISVDSAQIYRHMDIGTAKPSARQLATCPHHLIDMIPPTERYSVAQFCTSAVGLVEDIRRRGKIPLLVGGTMLYFNALQMGLSVLPPADAEVRRALQRERAQHGLAALHAELAEVDPQAAAKIHPNDPQRTLRALEVWRTSGIPISEHYRQSTCAGAPPDLKLGVYCRERSTLHERIATRFQHMLAQGLVDEVADLRRRYATLHADLPAMRCVGYRQVWAYLAGGSSREQMAARGVAATRQLAKRQLTWLRRMDDVHYCADGEDPRRVIYPLIHTALEAAA